MFLILQSHILIIIKADKRNYTVSNEKLEKLDGNQYMS